MTTWAQSQEALSDGGERGTHVASYEEHLDGSLGGLRGAGLHGALFLSGLPAARGTHPDDFLLRLLVDLLGGDGLLDVAEDEVEVLVVGLRGRGRAFR